MLGGAALRRRALQRGPGVRARARGAPALAQGLRAARRRAARARLPAGRSSCGATSTSTAACARRSATSSGSACARRCATCARSSPPTAAGCASTAFARRAHARWTARSLVHHTGRKVFSRARQPRRRAAGAGPAARSRSRAARTRRRRRPSSRPSSAPRRSRDLPAVSTRRGASACTATRRSRACCATARRRCSTRSPGMADRERLHIAFVIPPFSIGSGGHNIIFQLVLRLERMGHTCSLWLHDAFGERAHEGAAVMRGNVGRALRADRRRRCTRASTHWYGADVAVATGWQTVFPLLELPGVRVTRLPDQRPRARVLSRRRSSRSGPPRPTARASTGSPAARGCATSTSSATAGPPAASSTASTMTSTSRAPSSAGADTVVFYCRAVTQRRAVALGHPGARRAARAPPRRADRAVRRPPSAADSVPVRAHRHRQPRAARVDLLGGDGRRLPVAHELLADPAGDAGLRLAVRRPRGRERELRVRRRRPGRARAVRRRRARGRRRAAARRRRAVGAPLAGGDRRSSRRTRGTSPPSRSRRSCAPRCARASRTEESPQNQPPIQPARPVRSPCLRVSGSSPRSA